MAADTPHVDDGSPRLSLAAWLKTLLSGRPHWVIGGSEHPYLLRWFLIPRNRWFNVYLHKFLRDDDDRALHDHPWPFVSIILRGRYREHTPSPTHGIDVRTRGPGSFAARPGTHRHRVELFKHPDGTPIPCSTLFFTGPTVRTWGFWCPRGFVPWHQFVNRNDPGATGPGCGP